jgi:hypothetical protein
MVEIELDYRALEFIRESLAQAAGVARWVEQEEELRDGSPVRKAVPRDVRRDSLAHRMLKRHDLATGSIVTCVPGRTPQEALYLFHEGVNQKAALNAGENIGRALPNARSVPEMDAWSWLLRITREYLRGAPNKVCMYDSVIASAGDAWVARLDPRPHVFQNQVYFALFHRDAESRERE